MQCGGQTGKGGWHGGLRKGGIREWGVGSWDRSRYAGWWGEGVKREGGRLHGSLTEYAAPAAGNACRGLWHTSTPEPNEVSAVQLAELCADGAAALYQSAWQQAVAVVNAAVVPAVHEGGRCERCTDAPPRTPLPLHALNDTAVLRVQAVDVAPLVPFRTSTHRMMPPPCTSGSSMQHDSLLSVKLSTAGRASSTFGGSVPVSWLFWKKVRRTWDKPNVEVRERAKVDEQRWRDGAREQVVRERDFGHEEQVVERQRQGAGEVVARDVKREGVEHGRDGPDRRQVGREVIAAELHEAQLRVVVRVGNVAREVVVLQHHARQAHACPRVHESMHKDTFLGAVHVAVEELLVCEMFRKYAWAGGWVDGWMDGQTDGCIKEGAAWKDVHL
eukprot:353226-Chlamydomonas_euryale.AAC.3